MKCTLPHNTFDFRPYKVTASSRSVRAHNLLSRNERRAWSLLTESSECNIKGHQADLLLVVSTFAISACFIFVIFFAISVRRKIAKQPKGTFNHVICKMNTHTVVAQLMLYFKHFYTTLDFTKISDSLTFSPIYLHPIPVSSLLLQNESYISFIFIYLQPIHGEKNNTKNDYGIILPPENSENFRQIFTFLAQFQMKNYYVFAQIAQSEKITMAS